MTSDQDAENPRPRVPTGPIGECPPGFVSSEHQRLILNGWLEVTGLELGTYDRRIIEWASQAWDWSTFATVVSWIVRSYEAGQKSTQRTGE